MGLLIEGAMQQAAHPGRQSADAPAAAVLQCPGGTRASIRGGICRPRLGDPLRLIKTKGPLLGVTMAQSSNEPSLFGSWPGGLLIALLLGLGAIGWVQAPFKAERPTEPKEGLSPTGVQDVDARLWQDPFAAVATARKERKEAKAPESDCRTVEIGPDGRSLLVRGACPGGTPSPRSSTAVDHPSDGLQGQILSRAEFLSGDQPNGPGRPPVTVLGIMVSAGPSTGAAETRRRYRYAALSALMLEGFLPDDAEHIGYVNLGKAGPPEIVPYEWFTRTWDKARHQALVLLWLDDDSLAAPEQPTGVESATTPGAPRPLARLSRLLSKLTATEAAGANVGYELVGPAGSGTLQAMAAEYRDYLAAMPSAPPPAAPGPRLARLWSPFATIPDRYAATAEGERPVCPCGAETPTCVAVRPPSAGERTIVSDDVLAQMLVAELGRRQVAGNAGIALVGQWDTAYSRTLAELVEQAWRDAQARHHAAGGDIWVKRFSYMRGIDGQIPGAKPQGKGEGDAQAIERPGGDAQTDYLRRMRDALVAEDSRLRRACGFAERVRQHCGIRAIGVLGNDYFDKLLVLQALRPVFPDAVFFTTDLYADMLHPQDNAVTRNLLVASGYGLRLSQYWQREVPPLRDNYQTALLLTVRLAVRETLGLQPQIQLPPPPRLFEIGRSEAVELVTSPERDAQGQFRRAGVAPWQDPHPEAELSAHFQLGTDGEAGIQAMALPAAAALALALGLAAVGRGRVVDALRRWSEGLRRGWLPSAIVAFSLATTALVLGLLAHDLNAGGEPFSLIEGVSVWPSEILRLAAGLIAVYFFIHGQRRQQEARDSIEHDLPGLIPGRGSIRPPGPGAAPTPAQAPAPAQPCAALICEAEGPATPAAQLWTRYAAQCGLVQTLRRVWPEILGFLLLAYALMLAFGFPNRPTRSDLAWTLDLWIVLLVLVPFLALLFFMVDATRQTVILARDLRGRVSWPAETMTWLGLGAWVRGGQDPSAGGDIAWMDVKLIGAVTRPVGNLVWYPVVVLILMVLARHPIFDAWSLPPALILIMAVAIAYAVGCALALRRAAERVREQAVQQLSAALLRAQGRADAKECIEPLKTMLAAVVAARDGAFRPFSQQPVVQALLTLASSISGLALLQYSSMANL